MYYTYVIQSTKARMANHLKGRVRSNSHRHPLRLVYYEACLNEADARRRERYLKSGKGKRYLQQRLPTWIAENSQ